MVKRFSSSILLPIALILTACGGGGSGGSDFSTPAQNAGNTGSTPTAALEPTWSLSVVDPSDLNLAASDVDSIIDLVFSDQAVQSAMLIKDGYVIGERYSAGTDSATLGTSWSVAKSFYAIAVGVAIDEGWLEGLEQPASEILSEWVGTDLESVTIRQILEMRAGLGSGSTIFLRENQTEFALSAPKVRAEGSAFVYSNTTSQLIEPILRRATGLDAHSYLRQKVLTPIGVDTNQIGMWFDPSGENPLTYMGLDLSPVDMARFGLMIARDGTWEETQIVSSSFVSESLSPSSEIYGLHWWILNDAFFGEATPVSVVAALGLDGQKIYVWPDQDLVLVVLTQYEHSANQGYTLSDINFPNTCTARNSCPGATGGEVPSFDQLELMRRFNDLVN